MRKLALDVSISLYVMIAFPLIFFLILLFFISETGASRVFVLSAFAAFPIPVLLWFSGRVKRFSLPAKKLSLFLASLSLALLAFLYSNTPPGESLSKEQPQSIFLRQYSYQRTSLANLVPEIDQVKLGSYLFPLVDPFIDNEQGKHIRDLLLKVYRDMENSPSFSRLGSVLNYSYRDISFGGDYGGHLYTYIPSSWQNSSRSAILFLHGSMGNFKGYLWLWKQFADTHNFAIIAPSFGMGNWDQKGGIFAVEEARQYAVEKLGVNPSGIYLAGISNGGKGVSHVGQKYSEYYQGFICISPVLETDILLTWPKKEQPILVLHGEKDKRIPLKFLQKELGSLRQKRFSIQEKIYEKEDHFLFFSSPEKIFRDIDKFIQENKEN